MTPAELGRFVAAAREQVIVETNVTAEAVLAGLEQHRRRAQARRTLTLSAAIATLAASLIAVGWLWPMLSTRDAQPTPEVASLGSDRDPAHASDHTSGHDFASEAADPDHLASAVSLRTNATVEVRGPWSIALDEGVHELEVEATPGRALRVSLPDRELELELVEGKATIEVVRGTAAVRLHNGVAAWIGADGQRSVMSVERIMNTMSTEPTTNTHPSATELAREAELLLAAGKSDKAATVLRRLILAHPKANQTRIALLDLARLLRNAHHHDEARCAYQLYLRRWPSSTLDGEVRTQLDRLGPGRNCRGLDPR
jgi:hypothetical protein